jgi:hypothetical protein
MYSHITSHFSSTAAPLEVTTDATPAAPALTLTSATPLAFTFSSASAPAPYNSHLESYPAVHHHHSLKPALRLQTPPLLRSPSPMSPASPASDTSPVFSSPASSIAGRSPVRGESSHERSRSRSPLPRPSPAKRRRSTANAHEESSVRPTKGDKDYVKRPENAFILFRRKCVEERLQEQEAAEAAAATSSTPKPKRSRQADLSKMISQQWKGLTQEERTHWEDLAKEKKREHERLHPGYVYRPQRKEVKKPAPVSKKGKDRADTDSAPSHVEFTIPLNRHARSSSADSGFTSQTIRLPVMNVDMPTTFVNSPPRSHFAYQQSQPNMALPTTFPPHYQVSQRAIITCDKVAYVTSQVQPMYLANMWQQPQALQAPSHRYAGQMMSPTDTTSPVSPYDGPITPANMWPMPYGEPTIFGDSPCLSPGAFVPAPELHEVPSSSSMVDENLYAGMPSLAEQPWTFEFTGEFIPSDTDFLVDADFDLSQIPSVSLDELREIEHGSHPLSGWHDLSHVDLSAPALSPAAAIAAGLNTSTPSAEAYSTGAGPSMAGQDPFMGLYYNPMLSTGRF